MTSTFAFFILSNSNSKSSPKFRPGFHSACYSSLFGCSTKALIITCKIIFDSSSVSVSASAEFPILLILSSTSVIWDNSFFFLIVHWHLDFELFTVFDHSFFSISSLYYSSVNFFHTILLSKLNHMKLFVSDFYPFLIIPFKFILLIMGINIPKHW